MALSVRRYLVVTLLTVLCSLPVNAFCFSQLPENDSPPLDDEKTLPPSEVPVVKKDITRPFEEPGEKIVLDNQLPKADQTIVINGEELRPGEKPTFNEQMPGYESEAVRILDGAPLPSYNSPQQDTSSYTPITPLSGKEKRQLRKEVKNTPLNIPALSRDTYVVSGGKRASSSADSEVVISADSLITIIRKDTTVVGKKEIIMRDSLAMTLPNGNLTINQTTAQEVLNVPQLTPKQQREMIRMQRRADTTLYRHSPLFRDTIKVSPLTAISLVVPGFGQLYNGDYWKIPVLYATVGTSLFFGIKQHQQYIRYRNEYNFLMSRPEFSQNRALIDPVQTKMIQHNTWRQALFGAAIGTYIYFVGDAVLNYPSSKQNNVKTATTLSTICPGAGQIYNGSYWKAPIILGGFATFIYIIDWNNRGYKRYDRAIKLETDNDPDSHSDEFWNGSSLSVSLEQMKNYKRLYRRNRDLTIILTAAFYLFNIMDAHVDSQLKSFDINDDLTWQMRLQPSMDSLYTLSGGNNYSVGLNFSLTF